MMRVQWSLGLFCAVTATAALVLASCAAGQSYSAIGSNAVQPAHTAPTGNSSLAANTTSFSFSRGPHESAPMYTIQTSAPLSKLRHGHREFTINLAEKNKSLIIAFFGYTGPASYTLSNRFNGGDVRITLGQQFWDLSLVPTASCSLTILSDIPTEQSGLDRMQGRFSCPTLPPGELTKPAHPVTITDGAFDVLIVVES